MPIRTTTKAGSLLVGAVLGAALLLLSLAPLQASAKEISKRVAGTRVALSLAHAVGAHKKKPAKEVRSAAGGGGPLYWGAWIGEQFTGAQAPWDMSAVSDFEQVASKPLSLINFSSPFAACSGSSCNYYKFPTAPMENVRNHGAIPFFSWASQSSPSSLNQPDFQLAAIANGSLDPYIREFATEAKAWGHPFFLRFNWEMNGNWFPWSGGVNGNGPGTYVAAWRHVHDIFASVGATNATWVWCPYSGARGSRARIGKYYPGGEYVDWTCIDGYNWGRVSSTSPSRWQSFDTLFASSYRKITTKIAPGKPMMLGEIASNGGGKPKALWIKRMFASLPQKYPDVHGLVWFDCPDRTMSWTLESSPIALRAFSKGISDRHYLKPSFSALAESPISVPR